MIKYIRPYNNAYIHLYVKYSYKRNYNNIFTKKNDDFYNGYHFDDSYDEINKQNIIFIGNNYKSVYIIIINDIDKEPLLISYSIFDDCFGEKNFPIKEGNIQMLQILIDYIKKKYLYKIDKIILHDNSKYLYKDRLECLYDTYIIKYNDSYYSKYFNFKLENIFYQKEHDENIEKIKKYKIDKNDLINYIRDECFNEKDIEKKIKLISEKIIDGEIISEYIKKIENDNTNEYIYFFIFNYIKFKCNLFSFCNPKYYLPLK